MKIACIGNITYDILAYTNTYPKEDERTTYYKTNSGFGGPAANANYVLNKYGIKTDFYGLIGDDSNGLSIYNELNLNNINVDNISIINNLKTPFSFVIINETNDTRTINTCRDKLELEYENKIKIKNEKYDLIYTDGKYPNKFMELVKNNPNAIKIIDAGRCTETNLKICKEIDYIICSEKFLNDFIKTKGYDFKIDYYNEETIYLALKLLKLEYPKSKVCVTLGPVGIGYIDNDIFKTYNVFIDKKVVDTNASGDIFHGAFAYGIINNMSYEESLKFATKVARLSVSKYGGKYSTPDLNDVKINLEKEKTYKKTYRNK